MKTVYIIFLLCFLHHISTRESNYTLKINWTSKGVPRKTAAVQVVWDGITILNLTSPIDGAFNIASHQLSFMSGKNRLKLNFIAKIGQVQIQSIQIRQLPKNVNVLLNGDFQTPNLMGNSSVIFNQSILGWSGHQIALKTMPNNNQSIVLSSIYQSISQQVTFGQVKKYSFLSSLQNSIIDKAKKLITQYENRLNNVLNPRSSTSDILRLYDQTIKSTQSSQVSQFPSIDSTSSKSIYDSIAGQAKTQQKNNFSFMENNNKEIKKYFMNFVESQPKYTNLQFN